MFSHTGPFLEELHLLFLFSKPPGEITHGWDALSTRSPQSGLLDKFRHKRCKAFLGGSLPTSLSQGLRPGPEHNRNPVPLRT